MKILHVVGTAHFGGIERLVLDLTRVQYATGLKVGVFFYRAEGQLLESFGNLGVPIFSADLSSGYDMSPSKWHKITKIFREYDLLHLHAFNPVLAAAAAVSKKKIVYTEHGNFGFGRSETLSDRVKRHLLRLYLNRSCHYVTFNSDFTRRIAEQRYGLERVPREVVFNGIDLGRLNAGARTSIPEGGLLAGKFVVGTCSRFAGFKRIDRLIHVFANFQKGKNDVMLLLVGDGEKRKELEKQVAEAAISKITVFTGYRHNVLDYQAAMDVLVIPSQNEPFGLVALEAFSVGVPALAFEDGGGVVEVISGYSREDVARDAEAMISRLNMYYQNRNIRFREARSRADYIQKFDVNVMSSRLSNVYTTVLPCAA